MKKGNKLLVIFATSLIGIGLLLTLLGVAFGARHAVTINSDGITVVGGKRITETKELKEFKNIEIDAKISNIKLIPSDHYGIDYSYLEKTENLELINNDDTLKIKQTSKNLFFVVNFGFFNMTRNENYIKVYYPSDVNLDNISIESSMGTIDLEGIKANNLTIINHMGSVDIIKSDFLKGDFNLDMGDLDLRNVTFEDVTMELSMGNIDGNNITSKGLKATSNMGNIELSGTFYGKNDLNCSMGNIELETSLAKTIYNYNVSTNMGSVHIDGKKVSNSSVDNNGENTIHATSNMGNVNIDFNN